MNADDVVSAGPTANFLTVGVAIIPEVILVGKELVFVIEVDLIEPAVGAPPPTPVVFFEVVDGVDNVIDGTDNVVDI